MDSRFTPIVFASILLTLCLTPVAFAGANEGGVLILHGTPEVVYTAGMDVCAGFDLARCADATTEMPATEIPSVWFAVAAFPETISPRVRGIEFGIDWDDSQLVLSNFGVCSEGGFLELPSDEWPAPLSGTTVTYGGTPRTSLVMPVYWFAGYSYSRAPHTFAVIPHPDHGGQFGDDDVPSQLDPIAAYGSLGFGGDLGSLPCPDGGESGACCLDDCECVVVSEAACDELGGIWTADVECSLELCGCSAFACCLPDGTCEVLTPAECGAAGGEFFPEETCDPAPCETGACCLEDGSCVETTVQGCLALGGLFRPGLACGDADCQEPCEPVEVPLAGLRLSGARGAPNDGGVLIVHADPTVVYTDGSLEYCGLVDLTSCEDAVVRSDSDDAVVFSILAAFPPGSSPSLRFADFGIYFPTCITVLDGGGCGDSFFPGFSWPESSSGLSVNWSPSATEQLVEVAWIAVEVETGQRGEFALGPHPEYGGRLGYSITGQYSPIADYGRLGFRTSGYLPCPNGEATAACCFSDGSCQVLTRTECEGAGGSFVGESPECTPNPCSPVPVRDSSWGRIKDRFRNE